MSLRVAKQVISTLMCVILVPFTVPVDAAGFQTPPPASVPTVAPLNSNQLDALVAPIALYPDALVAQVLAAAIYPDQVAFADDWLSQNQNLQGNALAQEVDQQSWDPSVKALSQFPSVLHDLAKNLSWTSNLGQAFTNQQADVMAAVQAMRAKAQAAGTLKSTPQIKIVQQSPQTIVIQPASPQVVYVPQYNRRWCTARHTWCRFTLRRWQSLLQPSRSERSRDRSGVWRRRICWRRDRRRCFLGLWLVGCNWGGGGSSGGGNVTYNHNTYVNKSTVNRNSNNNNNSNNRNSNNDSNNHLNRNNNNGNTAGNRYNSANGPQSRTTPNGGANGNHG